MYDKTILALLIICIQLYVLTPEKGWKDVSDANAFSSWEVTIPDDVPLPKWCDAGCKVKTLINIGMDDRIAGSLVYTCKDKAKDPRHCIIIWSSILTAESGLGKVGKRPFGFIWFTYDTPEESVEHWVERYNKYWYRRNTMSDFYPPLWETSITWYCTEDVEGVKWCPDWLRNSTITFKKLNKLF